MTGLLRRLAVLVVVALIASACNRDDGPDVDQARLEVDGQATVTSADGTVETVTDDATLAFGDTVVVDEGTATLEFAAGQVYELRSGDVDSEVLIGSPPTLLAGDALLAAGFPVAMKYDTTTLTAQGAAKLQSGVPSAAAYAGRARISGTGDLEELVGLRQVVLTSSATPEPLVYDANDLWDRRFLGEAIAFGRRLEALARGYTAGLQGSGGRSVSFFESVIPALAEEREFTADLLGDRPPGEILVGASIVVQGRVGTFRERWESVFSFREAGAAWGLVALDQGVSSAPVLDTIELAIGGEPTSGEAPAPTPSPGPDPDTDPPPDPTDPTTTTGVATTTTTTTTTTTPGGILGPTLDPVDDVLTDVLDALGL